MSLLDETTFHAETRCTCFVVELGLTPSIAQCALCESAPMMRYALTVALARLKDIERDYGFPSVSTVTMIRKVLSNG